MNADNTEVAADAQILRRCIQKAATGPEYSKDLSCDEARAAMERILAGDADPVQTAVLLIALRMKRETDDENIGALRAIRAAVETARVALDHLVDLADPYDGFARGLPISPFLPATLAACGRPAAAHGVARLGPKYGATHRAVLRAAGADVDADVAAAVARLENPEIGWAYIDQSRFCPALHALIPLRARIVKRPLLTTLEVLAGPLRARQTHLVTGYVHKAYPPIYARLARDAGFDSAAIVRGAEGGVVPSLKQPARLFEYHDGGEEALRELDPRDAGIERATRGVPLPELPPAPQRDDHIAAEVDIDALARAAADAGLAALRGDAGPARDSLVYGGAIVLTHLDRGGSLAKAADAVRDALDSGRALARFEAARG